MAVRIVRGGDDVVESLEDGRGGLGCSSKDGQMSSELVDYNDLVGVEARGRLWEELGVKT